MSDTFPLLLKEGWPDHFFIMIQVLIPAGVVDCLFKFRIFSFEGFSYLIFLQIQVPGILICFQTSVLRIQGLQDIDLSFYLFLFYDIHHADFHQAQLQVF